MKPFGKNARVIFTGDSITAQTNYTVRIVDYYRRNLPEHNVRFYQAAIPGSTLSCAIKFFDDLILPFSPTHATVFFGINDCGRGWLNGDDKEKKLSLLAERYESFRTNLSIYTLIISSLMKKIPRMLWARLFTTASLRLRSTSE